MNKRKSFWQRLMDIFLALLTKLISFKNVLAAASTVVGVYVAFKLGASFMDWAKYQGFVLVLLYTSNQFQKWLFMRWPLLTQTIVTPETEKPDI